MKNKPSWRFLGAVEINGEWRCYWRKDYGDEMCQIHEGWHSPDTGLLDKGFAEHEIAFLLYTLQREGVAISHATIEPVREIKEAYKMKVRYFRTPKELRDGLDLST